jgi:hypothetical protein
VNNHGSRWHGTEQTLQSRSLKIGSIDLCHRIALTYRVCQDEAMNNEELTATNAKLRAFAASHGMQWILDGVDEAVSLGIPEVRTLRQSSQQGRIIYEDVTGLDLADLPSGRRPKRSEEFVSRRPMTELEQVVLLVEALRRVLVDSEKIASESIETLNQPVDRFASGSYDQEHPAIDLPPVDGIAFVPDEGSTSPTVDLELVRSSHSPRVAEILAQIEIEIRS